MNKWGNLVEVETRRRIKLAVWAYAYEVVDHSVVPDWQFDFESYQVNLSINTNRPDLDKWWAANFQPCTGMWVQKHPELPKIKALYERFYKP